MLTWNQRLAHWIFRLTQRLFYCCLCVWVIQIVKFRSLRQALVIYNHLVFVFKMKRAVWTIHYVLVRSTAGGRQGHRVWRKNITVNDVWRFWTVVIRCKHYTTMAVSTQFCLYLLQSSHFFLKLRKLQMTAVPKIRNLFNLVCIIFFFQYLYFFLIVIAFVVRIVFQL